MLEVVFRVGLRNVRLQTTLRHVCSFGQNYSTELRYAIFCSLPNYGVFKIKADDCLLYYYMLTLSTSINQSTFSTPVKPGYSDTLLYFFKDPPVF